MPDSYRICVIPGDGIGIEVVPPDLGGSGSTTDLGDAVLAGIEAGAR